MRQEVNMMLIIVICAILGIITAAMLYVMNGQGLLFSFLVSSGISLGDLQFLAFFLWLIVGIILGAMKS